MITRIPLGRLVVLLLALVVVADLPAVAKAEITFGVPWGADVFGGVLGRLVAAYEERHPDVEIHFEPATWGTDKLLTAAAGGTGPDVVGFGGPGTVRQIGEMVLQPIDRMVERYEIDTSRFF